MSNNSIDIEISQNLSMEEFNEIVEILIKYGYKKALPKFSLNIYFPEKVKIYGSRKKLNKYSEVFYQVFKEQGHIIDFKIIK